MPKLLVTGPLRIKGQHTVTLARSDFSCLNACHCNFSPRGHYFPWPASICTDWCWSVKTYSVNPPHDARWCGFRMLDHDVTQLFIYHCVQLVLPARTNIKHLSEPSIRLVHQVIKWPWFSSLSYIPWLEECTGCSIRSPTLVGLTCIVTVQLPARFCLGRWDFSRFSWAIMQDGRRAS